MDQFWPDLQLPKAKIKMPWATAECDKIPKMGKIICFYVNTQVLKSEPGYFVTFSHRYCTYKICNRKMQQILAYLEGETAISSNVLRQSKDLFW